MARPIYTGVLSGRGPPGQHHHAEGNSDAPSKSSLVNCEQLAMVGGGQLQLGARQKIYFCDFDDPGGRKLWAIFLLA